MNESRRPTGRASTGAGAKSKSTLKASDRVAHLVKLIDHCTAAQTIAEGLGDKFLSYMLAMTIQEARASLQKGD